MSNPVTIMRSAAYIPYLILRPCTLMDVLNGLHTEHDYESKPNKSGNRLSKASVPSTITNQSQQAWESTFESLRPSTITSLSQQACQSTSESQILPTTIVRLIPFRHNPLLLYPTDGYQQSIGTLADYVSVGDRWFIAISPMPTDCICDSQAPCICL